MTLRARSLPLAPKPPESGMRIRAAAKRNLPRTRADCIHGPRPCPYISCLHHLYLDELNSGAIKFNFPNREIEELEETCSLDVADRGGVTLQDAGRVMNVTRERARQLEASALTKLRKKLKSDEW